MDEYIFDSRFSRDTSADEVARPIGASDDDAYICEITTTATAMPAVASIGSVVRRASLIAAAVHACELASAESRIRRQSWIGHPSEARA